MVYEWKDGAPFRADANKVAAEVARLGPSPSPLDILLAARSSKSELHECFEWDDTLAAMKYRKGQARKILQSLMIVETREVNGEVQKIRVQAYEEYSDAAPGERGNPLNPGHRGGRRATIRTLDALADEESSAKVLADIRRQIAALEAKAAKYESISEALREIKSILAEAREEVDEIAEHQSMAK